MKIVVTGGAGFIGTNFIYYIHKKYPSYHLVCIDSLTYAGNVNNLKPFFKNEFFRFYKCSICDRNSIFKIFEDENPDVVINFAAESHVDRSIDSSELFLQTNILGTAVLMDACLKYNVKRFHQISTDEVYGDLPLDRPDLSFKEDSPLHPNNPYSASKASADLLILSYHRTHGLPATISRCSNNYGPYQHTEKLIPLMITNALANKPLPVYGTGENIRDWIHVSDHCNALDLIIHNGEIGEIYNIGANNEIQNIDIVKMICNSLGKSTDLIEYVTDRKGHDLRYAINANKLFQKLNWSPKIDFNEGINETLAWYMHNKIH